MAVAGPSRKAIMDRRPAAVIGALCVSVAVVGAPVASAAPGTAPRVEVGDLPVLSELPPLPADAGSDGSGESDASDEETGTSDESDLEMSGVQTAALVLAMSVLVAGGLGLALVTRRGLGAEPNDQEGRPGPSAGARPR